MQYLYLFIFIFFIMLNVVIGLVSSRSKKRRAAAQKVVPESKLSRSPDEDSEQSPHIIAQESVLRPQTADSLVESFFEVEEETASMPGGIEQPAVNAAYGETMPQSGRRPEQVKGPGGKPDIEIEESKPMVDMSGPSKEVELPIEKDLLESEVESRAVERRKAQDEKYLTHDLYGGRKAENAVWGNINKLPPLKRAIIFAEILGLPRALSEGRYSE